MEIIFLGTPEFALPSLTALVGAGHRVLAAVTQPDRPKGRGGVSAPPPVKILAEKYNIPVYQFEKIRQNAADLRNIFSGAADKNSKDGKKPGTLMVTAAYGQILSQEIIDIPEHGILNVHASLLPKYRGAAPVQWALINGEKETGVSIMRTEAGIDCGDVLLQRKAQILPGETAGELLSRLSQTGAECLIEAIGLIERGKAVYAPQDEAAATYFPMLRKTDGEINWNKSATAICNLIRGTDPWPGAYTYSGDSVLKIWKAEETGACEAGERGIMSGGNGCAGEVIKSDKSGIIVRCGAGTALRILELQPAGGRRMTAAEFSMGRGIPAGTIFCGQL